MTLTINDTTMTSDQTPHTARQARGRPHQWEVSWLPGQILDRNATITAMLLADTAAQGDLHEGHRLWPHIQGWAAELGLTDPDAIAPAPAAPLRPGPGPLRQHRRDHPRWINLFADFLVTKHGLAEALQSDDAAFETLHAYFLDRLVPVCAQLLDAAATAGEIRPGMDAYELLRGVGNLCIGADSNPRYYARRMVELVIAGLRLH
jgi:hypothetical protein